MNSARSFAAIELGTTRMCGASATLNTGTRSTSGSKGSECSRKGLMTRFPPAPISSVWPSAGDFTTYSMATLPDAPALFSTTTCRPSCCARPSAATRPRMSVSPPGDVSTTILMARLGYALCAAEGAAPAPRASPRKHAAAIRRELRGGKRIVSLIDPDVRFFHDSGVALALALQERAEVLWPTGHGIHPERGVALAQVARLHRIAHLGGETLARFSWRAGRGEVSDPGDHLETGQLARFVHRHDLRQRVVAPGARDSVRLEPPGPH